ncbi:hypothetical protein QTN25_002274 [Entamoeba marina]
MNLKEAQTHLLELFDQQQRVLNEIFTVTKFSLNAPKEIQPTTHRYWSSDEHLSFLICLAYLNSTSCKKLPVKSIAEFIQTRSSLQVRTHAQKYFKDSKQRKDHFDINVMRKMKEQQDLLRKVFHKERAVMMYRVMN